MSESTPAADPLEVEETVRKRFDEKAVDAATEAARELLLHHDDIRSIAVVIDYAGDINNSPGIRQTAIVSASGSSFTLAETSGLIRAMHVATGQVQMLGVELSRQLRDALGKTAGELRTLRKEVEDAKAEKAALTADVNQLREARRPAVGTGTGSDDAAKGGNVDARA